MYTGFRIFRYLNNPKDKIKIFQKIKIYLRKSIPPKFVLFASFLKMNNEGD